MPQNSFPARASFSGWTTVLSLLLLSLLAVFLADGSIDRWVLVHRTPAWEFIAKTFSRVFAWHWLMLGAAVALVAAWWWGRRDWMRVLCVMMVAASIAGLSADILRGLTGRTRPSAPVVQGWHGVRSEARWLIFNHAYNSFPSGHTTAAMGFALPLFLWRRRAGLVVFPFVVLVAAARISVGAHHLSDVLAGAALGSLVALLIWRRSNGGERLVNAVRPWREPA